MHVLTSLSWPGIVCVPHIQHRDNGIKPTRMQTQGKFNQKHVHTHNSLHIGMNVPSHISIYTSPLTPKLKIKRVLVTLYYTGEMKGEIWLLWTMFTWCWWKDNHTFSCHWWLYYCFEFTSEQPDISKAKVANTATDPVKWTEHALDGEHWLNEAFWTNFYRPWVL